MQNVLSSFCHSIFLLVSAFYNADTIVTVDALFGLFSLLLFIPTDIFTLLSSLEKIVMDMKMCKMVSIRIPTCFWKSALR